MISHKNNNISSLVHNFGNTTLQLGTHENYQWSKMSFSFTEHTIYVKTQ